MAAAIRDIINSTQGIATLLLKAYLKRNGIKQNAFFLDCIRQALAEDTGTAEE